MYKPAIKLAKLVRIIDLSFYLVEEHVLAFFKCRRAGLEPLEDVTFYYHRIILVKVGAAS